MRKWHWSRDSTLLLRFGWVMVMVAMMGSCVAAAIAAEAPRPSAPLEEVIFEVFLNGQTMHQSAMVLLRPDAKVLARLKDAIQWRLRTDGAAPTSYHTHQNEPYVLLDNLGLSYRVDNSSGELWIDAKVDQLLPSIVEAGNALAPLALAPATGAFFNYDLSLRHAQSLTTLGAQLELGMFAYGWVGTTQLLNSDWRMRPGFIRLESSLTLDRPEKMASLRLGDATSRAGAWGKPVRFAGIQWGTNFTTRPDFITFPLPSVSGSAALPSTAQLFVNQVLSAQHEIEAGPFTVRELPVFTGKGEIQMVVRDLLGREQTLVQPFYAAPTLLRKGLDDFSYEVGVLREKFGVASNAYGPWLLSATRRHGVSKQVTLEGRAELRAKSRTLGLAATVLWPRVGLIDAALATSASQAGAGTLLSLAVSRQTKNFSFALRTERTSAHFDQIGATAGAPALRRQSSAQASWNDARFGTFGLAYVRIEPRGQAANAVLSASYGRNLGRNSYLSVSAFRSLGTPNYALSVFLTHAFGKKTTASVNATHSSKPMAAVLQVQQNPPAGPGIGYRLQAGIESSARLGATLNLQRDYGIYSLEGARFMGENGYRAFASGGMALMDRKVFLTRRIDSSFAIVRVPGYANVQVFAENQPITRTDASGAALLPSLRPYQRNKISIGQDNLPLDVLIEVLETDLVPYYRSGYTVLFPVTKSSGAVLRIVDADGKAVPVGAQAQITGQQAPYPVALGGQVYLLDLKAHNHVEVWWHEHRCRFDIAFVETSEPLRDLGEVTCREMAE